MRTFDRNDLGIVIALVVILGLGIANTVREQRQGNVRPIIVPGGHIIDPPD